MVSARKQVLTVTQRIEEMIEDALETESEGRDPLSADLVRVGVLHELIGWADAQAQGAAAVARANGRTWPTIAEATGLPSPGSASSKLGGGRERERQRKAAERQRRR